MTSSAGQHESSMDSAESHASQALDAWYAAWNAHDIAEILALTTPDITYEDPMAPQSVLSGHGQVEGYLQAAMLAIPDLHIQMLEKWASPGGQDIVSSFHFTATFTGPLAYPGATALAATGRPVRMNGMDRSEIQNGRLRRHQIFWDGADFGRQMGLLPARNSTLERAAFRPQHLAARRMRRTT